MSLAHRKVALRLHGLSPIDQRWVITRLAGEDRDQVRQYLDELNAFDMDADTWQTLHDELGVAKAATVSDDLAVDPVGVAIDRQQLALEPAWVAAALGVTYEGDKDENNLSSHLSLSNVTFTDKASMAFRLACSQQLTTDSPRPYATQKVSKQRSWFDTFKARMRVRTS